ncbi:TetR/AcrR family transcriptional regulator [Solitalea canadensis]|uniref:Transcriptional regulator n=1 Tax=Solitalea canadensis (strain ATCC 29591 / DSM 3403 / JCM 21819 / LMG 8368 / NBRC 15130 / NCIMB 12057 / USAM 9D) TaxID=929556 RepID=H8KUU3_SOLCM|nr:TetR/AcrR family transcriptional regulator [Solitalea canadensis]AFD07577.1 transcriptional regulator [Solitalea canadensis DSM 3403]
MSKKNSKELDNSTEEKIKEAAKKLFMQKGFAATKTRDIAMESGINLALLNYYFRSKEKLFEIIIRERLQQFIQGIKLVFNDESTTFYEKIETLAAHYIDMLSEQPDLPLFILSELRAQPLQVLNKLGVKDFLMSSVFIKQLFEEMKTGNITQVHPLHFMANLMGSLVFPFVASPILKGITEMDQDTFNKLMQERKKLVPQWIIKSFRP